MTDNLRDRIAAVITGGVIAGDGHGAIADAVIRELPELQPCPFCHLTHNRCDCLRSPGE